MTQKILIPLTVGFWTLAILVLIVNAVPKWVG